MAENGFWPWLLFDILADLLGLLKGNKICCLQVCPMSEQQKHFFIFICSNQAIPPDTHTNTHTHEHRDTQMGVFPQHSCFQHSRADPCSRTKCSSLTVLDLLFSSPVRLHHNMWMLGCRVIASKQDNRPPAGWGANPIKLVFCLSEHVQSTASALVGWVNAPQHTDTQPARCSVCGFSLFGWMPRMLWDGIEICREGGLIGRSEPRGTHRLHGSSEHLWCFYRNNLSVFVWNSTQINHSLSKFLKDSHELS